MKTWRIILPVALLLCLPALTYDTDTTELALAKGLSFSPITTGPAYGTNLCGLAYRITGEAAGDPALVFRCNAYFFETADDGPVWQTIIGATGTMVGVRSSLTVVPKGRFEVLSHGGQNTLYLSSEGDTSMYVRNNAPDASRDACHVFDVAGEPKAAFGRCPRLFGSSYENALTYGKYISGTGWQLVGVLMTY